MDTRDYRVDETFGALRVRARSDESARLALGRLLMAARNLAGFTQERAAQHAGPAISTVSAVERGEQVPNKVTMLALLALYRPHCEIGVHAGRIWMAPR